jgi:hypothetical protein
MDWGRFRLITFCTVVTIGPLFFYFLVSLGDSPAAQVRFLDRPLDDEIVVVRHQSRLFSRWDIKPRTGSCFFEQTIFGPSLSRETANYPSTKNYSTEEVSGIQRDLIAIQSIYFNRNYFFQQSWEVDFRLKEKLYQYDFADPAPDEVKKLISDLKLNSHEGNWEITI